MESHEQPQIAVYPGTFDPITKGHIDIIARALRLFQNVIVAVAPNPGKTPLFNIDERVSMIRHATRKFSNLGVETFSGLLIHYIRKKGAIAIIRGIRAVSDFEYEFQMALMNRNLDRHIETVFLMPSEKYTYLSSSLIKEVASYGGEISDLVPEIVSTKMAEKNRIKKNLA
ncbi:MAG: pantetheine-phosphate adenylyltransferase [Nitrospiria bacterium]